MTFTFVIMRAFPLALILAWAFELTPEGIKREADVDRLSPSRHVTGPKARLRDHWAVGDCCRLFRCG